MPAETLPAKPSFAKVAASALYKNTKVPSIHSTAPAVGQDVRRGAQTDEPLVVRSTPSLPPEGVSTQSQAVKDGSSVQRPSIGPMQSPPICRGEVVNPGGTVDSLLTRDVAVQEAQPTPLIAASLLMDENSTQVSSSGSSAAKAASLDGKSTLDEKESIRPDESASVKAAEDDDASSALDFTASSSRVGSDNEPRAFGEQFRQIHGMGTLPPRGVPIPKSAEMPLQNGAIVYTSAAAPPPSAQSPPAGSAQDSSQLSRTRQPDPQLVEALGNPKNRIYLLKLEEDYIRFINEPMAQSLDLPPGNTFQRMLAHKLADYYFLAHGPDSSLTAVRVSKTPNYFGLPPPLGGFPLLPTSNGTPAGSVPARKIMRRGGDPQGDSIPSTNPNSKEASKAASEIYDEAGERSPGRAAEQSSKTAQERINEKLARYNAVRERIFAEDKNNATSSEKKEKDKDVSRSSSVTGKKNKKKQRNKDDDGFEARSQYFAYYTAPYGTPGYNAYPMNGDTTYYGPYDPTTQQSQQFQAPGMGFPQPYGMVDPSMQSMSQYPVNPAGMGTFSPTGQPGYDLSADFQRGMQSFQTTGISQQAPMSGPPPPGAAQGSGQWFSPYQPNSGYPSPLVQYTPVQSPYSERPTSAHSQSSSPHIGFGYGQVPAGSYQNGNPGRFPQHPMSGNYNRQQFNPQSQAFVPGGPTAYPFPMQSFQGPQFGPSMNGFNPGMPRPSPPSQFPPAFGASSPRIGQPNPPPMRINFQTGSQSVPQPPHNNPSGNMSSTQSTISKWGTPAHLPKKPPPPANPGLGTSSNGASTPGPIGPHHPVGHVPGSNLPGYPPPANSVPVNIAVAAQGRS